MSEKPMSDLRQILNDHDWDAGKHEQPFVSDCPVCIDEIKAMFEGLIDKAGDTAAPLTNLRKWVGEL